MAPFLCLSECSYTLFLTPHVKEVALGTLYPRPLPVPRVGVTLLPPLVIYLSAGVEAMAWNKIVSQALTNCLQRAVTSGSP